MKINKKQFSAGLMTMIIASATFATTAMANTTNNNNLGTPEQQADITNWIANTPAQVSNNMAMQHIDPNNLNGVRYVIQWGDTLSSISAATGISVAKLCYDNHIENANLIYAGNILILNKDGYVPDDYHPHVDPYIVAQTKVTINNGPTFVNIEVQPGAIKQYYNDSDNSKNTTNIYKAGDDTSSQAASNKSSDSSNSDNSSSDSNTSSSDSVSASDVVDGLKKANNNDKLSFTEGSDGTELSISSDDIAKAVKDDDYSALLDKITSALDSDKDDEDVTISIDGDGDDLHVYASYSKRDDDKQSSDDSSEDSQSSDKDDEDKDSQSSDDDSQSDDDDNSKADTNDEDTDTTTDDE
ncbi:LysM peptidoglycan-binding domain-containing protein [Lactobacillus sp. PV037]|uniref:LysM peptidoglycan-binding domain-containing protein n=1 Tax=unclassified Lactobacillus TaxID=2620435 RepID=UPI0022403AB7|nr:MULTISPECIES: LysM domain-containing protein [unclassified Lactobacillus]QNQ82744.1 LysM peptidoglycan-binding domain-containing protein [Lactobacillus sp. PV012]QNQ83136.1 LysM peptidoglycan-binding domain-containing protein [Lactobacillus sp. PV037]